MLEDELPFRLGDTITVLDSTSNPKLWYGACREKTGWFPSSYVRVRKNYVDRFSDVSNVDSVDEYPKQMRNLRRKVIEELMNTERDYVKLLENLVDVSINCSSIVKCWLQKTISKVNFLLYIVIDITFLGIC